MDPITQLLSPFIPIATIVIGLVALVRYGLSKRNLNLEGWGVVGLAAVLSVLVCLWTQRRVGAVDWMKLALDAPAVLVLAAGGTAWAKRLTSGAAKETTATVMHTIDADDIARAIAASELAADDFSFAPPTDAPPAPPPASPAP